MFKIPSRHGEIGKITTYTLKLLSLNARFKKVFFLYKKPSFVHFLDKYVPIQDAVIYKYSINTYCILFEDSSYSGEYIMKK